MRRVLVTVGLMACLLSAIRAGASPTENGAAQLQFMPQIEVTVDGVTQSAPFVVAGTSFRLANGGLTLDFPNGDRVRLDDVSGDVDPFIAAAVAVTDLGAPSSFAFTFSTPITPIAGPALVSSQLIGTLTDAGSDGVSISPFSTPLVGQFLVNSVDNVGVDIGPSQSSPGPTAAYGPFSAAGSFDCTTATTPPCNSIYLSFSFTGSGGGDLYTLSGRFDINASVCGDGVVAAGEVCDDGNTTSGDGCAAACDAVEAGWSCPPAGGPCTEICGDGLVVGSEQCDDGNTMSFDGCSDTCQSESSPAPTLSFPALAAAALLLGGLALLRLGKRRDLARRRSP